jgi:hypothetical protein
VLLIFGTPGRRPGVGSGDVELLVGQRAQAGVSHLHQAAGKSAD